MTPKHTLIHPQKQDAGRAQSRPRKRRSYGDCSPTGRGPWGGVLVAPATNQGTLFNWQRDLARRLKPAWTEIAQYISGDICPDFQVFYWSPREISTVAEISSRPRDLARSKKLPQASRPLWGARIERWCVPSSFSGPLPTRPLGKRDSCLGGGPQPRLSCAPRWRRTPLPLGALRVCSRPLPRPVPGGSRHQRTGGFPHISPISGPASRRTGGGVQLPDTGQGRTPRGRVPPRPSRGCLWDTRAGRPHPVHFPGARWAPPIGAHKTVPVVWGHEDPGVPWAPSSSICGTAPRTRFRGSFPLSADLVPRLWVGLIQLHRVPDSRGPMASADAANCTAAVAVDSRGAAFGDVLGEKDEINGALAFLLSASWPTSAVVDDSLRQFSWDLGGHLVEQRYAAMRAAAWSVYGRPSGPTTARCTPSPRRRQQTSCFSATRRTGGCVGCSAIWRSGTSRLRWATSRTSLGIMTLALPPRWGRRTPGTS